MVLFIERPTNIQKEYLQGMPISFLTLAVFELQIDYRHGEGILFLFCKVNYSRLTNSYLGAPKKHRCMKQAKILNNF